ncbi:MAG: hypothetical protein GX354_07080 [Firmicutes bacterium]|jgi:DNA-binding GntR family transcriptional regulator|nr:hypothetical protein [Bacillota bacterium]
MSAVPETKKEQILRLARQDPFLKVEEIAAKVDTTPRYVRTILSEAKISLMQLRRSYARRMEQRLGIDVGIRGSEPGLTTPIADTDRCLGSDEIRIHKVERSDWATLLGVAADEPLLMLSRVRMMDGQPFFVSQVVTTGDFSLSEEMLASDMPLPELLGLTQPDATELKKWSLEVEPADPYITACLGVSNGEPVMRSGNLIVAKGRPVGLEFSIFPAYGVRFILDGDGEYELRVVEKTG